MPVGCAGVGKSALSHRLQGDRPRSEAKPASTAPGSRQRSRGLWRRKRVARARRGCMPPGAATDLSPEDEPAPQLVRQGPTLAMRTNDAQDASPACQRKDQRKRRMVWHHAPVSFDLVVWAMDKRDMP